MVDVDDVVIEVYVLAVPAVAGAVVVKAAVLEAAADVTADWAESVVC